MTDLTTGLARAQERLRAQGLVGQAAYDVVIALLDARRRGEPVSTWAEVAALLPEPSPWLYSLAYERFFPERFKAQQGQFFTPEPLVRLLWSRLTLEASSRVVDPTCGSGGLLLPALERGAQVGGIERDPRLVDLANRLLGPGAVRQADAWTCAPEPADVLVANPPFSVPIDDDAVREQVVADLGPRARSDQALLHALHRWVRPGGQAAVVLPHSIVANRSQEAVRQWLRRDFRLEALCLLPSGVFRPFGGAQGRAALVWLRREQAPRTGWYAELSDPGYDVRLKRFVATDSAELDARIAGEGFVPLPVDAWTPTVADEPGTRLRDLAKLEEDRARGRALGEGTLRRLDLADTDRDTGEVGALPVVERTSLRGPRLRLRPGAVVVSRLRPRLGRVAVVPDEEGVVGSPEWVPLRSATPRALFHLLRTPTWRRSLPEPAGQTHPRVDAEDLLDSAVPWPSSATVARLDAVSSELFAERRRLRQRLERLQEAVDAFAAGELDDEALRRAIDDL